MGRPAASGWYCTEKASRLPSSSVSSRPSTTSSFRQTWLTRACPRGGWASQGRVDGEAVVLRGDLDLAGAQVFDGLIDPAVAVLRL